MAICPMPPNFRVARADMTQPDLEAAKDATHRVSSDAASMITLVAEIPGNPTEGLPKETTGRARELCLKWPNIMFPTPNWQTLRTNAKAAAWLLVSYVLTCFLSAVAVVGCNGLLAYLTLLSVAVFPNNLSSHHKEIFLMGSLGASILSVGFTTVYWVFSELEDAYERAYGIYDPSSPEMEMTTPAQRERNQPLPPTPKLAHRYRCYVAGVCAVLGSLVVTLFGPVIGALILIKHGVTDGAFTAMRAMEWGGIMTGVLVGIILVCVAACLVVEQCYSDNSN